MDSVLSRLQSHARAQQILGGYEDSQRAYYRQFAEKELYGEAALQKRQQKSQENLLLLLEDV